MANFERVASRRAEAVLKERQLDTLPIDPIALAQAVGIEVLAKHTKDGVSGVLLRLPSEHGDSYVIGYSTHIDNEGFRRFAIGHELGHYFLPGHFEKVLSAEGIHESRAGFATRERHEIEADHFSSGLLMPSAPFRRAARSLRPGFVAVEALARECNASLTATAIRYAELADEPVAAVVSVGPEISYCFMSETLQTAPGISWIRKRDRLPVGSATEKFNRDPSRVARRERREDSGRLRDWFDGAPDVEVSEDVVGLGSYGRTLTILVAESWPDEEEVEADDAAEWNPTFRKSRRR